MQATDHLGQILEALIFARMNKMIYREIRSSQVPYRSHRSCSKKLLALRAGTQRLRDAGWSILLLLMEFSATFDCTAREALVGLPMNLHFENDIQKREHVRGTITPESKEYPGVYLTKHNWILAESAISEWLQDLLRSYHQDCYMAYGEDCEDVAKTAIDSNQGSILWGIF